MPQQDRVPIGRQLPLHATPQPLEVPLPIDVVLEDERAPVPVLDDLLDRARVAPVGRDDALVDLSTCDRFVVIPQRVSDIEVRIEGNEGGESAGFGVRFEVCNPVAVVGCEVGVIPRREAVGIG